MRNTWECWSAIICHWWAWINKNCSYLIINRYLKSDQFAPSCCIILKKNIVFSHIAHVWQVIHAILPSSSPTFSANMIMGSPSCPSGLRLLDTPGINVETFHQKHLQDILEMCEKKTWWGRWFHGSSSWSWSIWYTYCFYVQKNHTNYVWWFPWCGIWVYDIMSMFLCFGFMIDIH